MTRSITVRGVSIGGGNPVVIQSMTNTSTEDVEATLEQIDRLKAAGCKIVRVSVPSPNAARAFRKIRDNTEMPLVADIHFSHSLAIAAIEAGADKIRINPGNIGAPEKVRAVADAAKNAGIPIRIGVNSGSLQKELLKKYGRPCPDALVESAMQYIGQMESYGFDSIVLSIKASNVPVTIDACRLLATKTDYPQHIGITEAGTVRSGSIRSAVGLGALLADGIGDTIRVSLAGDPVEEIFVAKEILKSLGLAKGPTVIACPTCSRTSIDVAGLAQEVEQRVASIESSITIAVMGCVVNGPGEAREADVGIAGGGGRGQIFVKGEPVATVPEEQLLDALMEQLHRLLD